jgi:hypothetical protein
MKRVGALCLFVIVSLISSACYVKQDDSGNWWACESYQASSGPADACYALPGPPF